jgi:hypothetical protein
MAFFITQLYAVKSAARKASVPAAPTSWLHNPIPLVVLLPLYPKHVHPCESTGFMACRHDTCPTLL